MMNNRQLVQVTVTLCILLAGCGTEHDLSSNKEGKETYENAQFGVRFDYPSDWTIRAEETGSPFLDIHLANNIMGTDDNADDYLCPPGSQAMELQIGHTKDTDEDVTDFLRNEGLENPDQPPAPFILDGIHAWKIADSRSESCISGPGYYLEQDDNHYTYIFTGNSAENDDTIVEIIRSIHFAEPSKE